MPVYIMRNTPQSEFNFNVFLLYVLVEENIVLLVKQRKIMENHHGTVNLSFNLNIFNLNLAQLQAKKANTCEKSFFLKSLQPK